MYESTTVGAGSGNRITEAQMARHEGLVRWVVRRQWLGVLSFQDALHEGRIGLWCALRRYDPERGTAFSSYAVPAIAHAVWRAVAMAVRSAAGPPHAPSRTDGPEIEALDCAQIAALLRQLTAQLPPRLRQVVVAHHGLADAPPQSFAAIGAVLGVSRQRVHQLHGQAILWLAHPDHSLLLRRLLERCSRRDYQQALARQRQARRRRVGR